MDTYGGFSRHGGGAFSGKDPTKVDRSGAYMARYIAKNIVAAGIARKCEVQIAYAIGVSDPISVEIETFSSSNCNEGVLVEAVKNSFDLTPNGIIRFLGLNKPIYKETASYGHFGNDKYPWEKLDRITKLDEEIQRISDRKLSSSN